jgi:hypothetical protein
MGFDFSRFKAKSRPRPSNRLRIPKATEDVFFHPDDDRRTDPVNVVRDGDDVYIVVDELVQKYPNVKTTSCVLALFYDGKEECLMPARVDRGSDLDVVKEAAKKGICRLVWRDGARHIEASTEKIEPKWSTDFESVLAEILTNNVIEDENDPVFRKLRGEGDAAA